MRIARFESPDGQTYTGRLLDEQTARPLTGDLFGPLTFADETIRIDRLLPPIYSRWVVPGCTCRADKLRFLHALLLGWNYRLAKLDRDRLADRHFQSFLQTIYVDRSAELAAGRDH